MNHLEELISEWYSYNGYYVKRNIKVGKRKKGGYKGELDIVAFHPKSQRLVHIETSVDSNSWSTRETIYLKKFQVGRDEIPKLYPGLKLPKKIEQEAVLLLGAKSRETLGGGKLVMAYEYLKEIYDGLKDKKHNKEIVPEHFPLLRTIQLIGSFEKKIIE